MHFAAALLISNPTYLNQRVLTILPKINHLNHLKQLQSLLTILGHSQSQFYSFKLLRFCALNLSNLTYARSIFDHLHSPNIYLYTAMVTAYASLPDRRSAFFLYRNMVRLGTGESPKPNHYIFPHLLRLCEGARETESVHTQIVKWGFGEYSVVQTALVDSYSRSASEISVARKVFDEMSERSVVSWTVMISGYIRVGEFASGMSLFEQMPERDVPSWNAVIAGCTQNGLFSEAISIFGKMVVTAREEKHRHNRPNQVSVVCVLSACGHNGMLHLGKSIHGYLYRNCLDSDLFVSNSLVDMYGKCGNLEEARRVFDMAPKKRLTSWNSIINCYALHGQSERAMHLFEEMVHYRDDVAPDEITFLGLLNACVHAGLVEKGRFYFQMMTREYGIEPEIQHYGCLIDVLVRAGRFEEAMEVVRGMKIEPDEVVWGSLLNGCKIHGRTDLAELAVKKLMDIDTNNRIYGIQLSNLYGELGNWDEARKVRKTLKDQNAYKTPGCSWIEVHNKVRQFYSVDKTHPKTEEIYNMLDTLFACISSTCWSSDLRHNLHAFSCS